MKLLHSEALLAALIAQRHLPYSHFPARMHAILGDVMRAFELRPGDDVRLVVGEQPTYLSVLEGCVKVGEAELPQVSLERGQTQLVSPCGGRLTLAAPQGARLCIADGEAIDELMSFDTLVEEASASDRVTMEAIERARRSPAFRRVPLECVEEAFHRMGRVTAAVGTEVIRQGERGELFYVIASGGAEVWQTGLYDDAPRLVAQLGPGDAFGEEALVTGGTRGATVRVVADTELLTLGKPDYQALISQQMVEEIEPAVAQTMLSAGYRLLDVRYAEEHEDSCIHGARLIPLQELRGRIGELEPDARWIVYCRSGKRSAVAALLLRQRGLQAISLRGGIGNWPYETVPGAPAA